MDSQQSIHFCTLHISIPTSLDCSDQATIVRHVNPTTSLHLPLMRRPSALLGAIPAVVLKKLDAVPARGRRVGRWQRDGGSSLTGRRWARGEGFKRSILSSLGSGVGHGFGEVYVECLVWGANVYPLTHSHGSGKRLASHFHVMCYGCFM